MPEKISAVLRAAWKHGGSLLLPRVEHRHLCIVEIAPVACAHRKPVVKSGRRYHEIGMRISMSGLPTVFHQQPPF